jgi:hypothetical protein
MVPASAHDIIMSLVTAPPPGSLGEFMLRDDSKVDEDTVLDEDIEMEEDERVIPYSEDEEPVTPVQATSTHAGKRYLPIRTDHTHNG